MKFLTFIYNFITELRNFMYDKGFLKVKRVKDTKIICIGNITVGGTGKTPAVQYFVKRLLSMGKKVAVVSRGYRGVREHDPLVVSDGKNIFTSSKESGDEAYLHALNLKVPVVVGKDRYVACEEIKSRFSPDIIIMDDGFQHRKLYRDKNIVLIDATNPFGGGYTLPYGRLRENINQLRRADELILTKSSLVSSENLKEIIEKLKKYNKNISITDHKETTLYNLKNENFDLDYVEGKKILIFSGLAKPENFEKSIRKFNPLDVYRIDYQDHHIFTLDSYKEIREKSKEINADLVITTEKDLVKLDKNLLPDNLMVLKIEFTFLEDNVCWKF